MKETEHTLESPATQSPTTPARDRQDGFRERGPAHELGLWLRALRSFMDIRSNTQAASDQSPLMAHDFANDVRIARRVLVSGTKLAYSLIKMSNEPPVDASVGEDGKAAAHLQAQVEMDGTATTDAQNRSFFELADALKEGIIICDALLEKGSVDLNTWASLGKTLARAHQRSEAARIAERVEEHYSTASLQESLVALARQESVTVKFRPQLLHIFTELSRLLKRLQFIEALLNRDQPLKQTLPIFSLIHAEANRLIEFIEACLARPEELGQVIIEALDVMNFSISMELRKVYTHELVGISALRQSPAIYARIETAHGLLRNSFQQSIVGLAQLFEPTLDGSRLFNTFQNRLEQSLALRSDLWALLQLVNRAEMERDQRPVSHLVEKLSRFREGSLRYLMYKDWESCERFIEEVSAARGAIELTPVLNRFGAYLETLFNQVSMRVVLANHPFDHPAQGES